MKPTSAHNTKHADDARMIDDDAKEQTEEGRSALHAAPRAPIHAAANAEKHSDSSSSSVDESKQQETAAAEPTPAPSTRRSKRVRESQSEASAGAADPLTAAAPSAAASSSTRSSKQTRIAATSSGQQQKADSASAKKKISGRRGSHAEPKETESAPEAAAAAASSPAPKRKSAAAPSSKSAASSKSTAVAAAPARPSPFSRLDADSLGIALSCLDSHEFLVARLVSRQWHAASAKRTAWPRLKVDDFIRLMQNDAYDDPSRRRLVVDSDDKLRSFVQRFSTHPFQDVFGKHVSEVKLSLNDSGPPTAVVARQALLLPVLPILASQFQFLSALTLDGCGLEQEAIQQLYTALAPRLRFLILSNSSSASNRQLFLLTQLRVLVVDALPPAEALRSLVSLQYLHLSVPPPRFWSGRVCDSNHGRVLRWLSANHALRSLSIETDGRALRIHELLASTEAEAIKIMPWEPALPAPIALDPPLDFTVPARFTDLSIGGPSRPSFDHWSHVPDLRRLQLEYSQYFQSMLLDFPYWNMNSVPQYKAHNAGVTQMLARLTEIRINVRFSEYHQTLSIDRPFQELRSCSSLRRLTFTTDLIDEERTGKQAKPISLPPLLRALSATIEEIRLGVEVLIAFQRDADGEDANPVHYSAWATLAVCKQLRVLEISFSDSMPDSFLRALSSLPAFRSLELSFRSDLPRIPPTMLRRMLESSSWSALHLFSVGHPEPRRFDPLQPRSGGLTAQLADLQRDSPHLLSPKLSNRVRLYVHLSTQSRVRTYRIVTDEDTGTLAWESDQ